MLEGGGDLAGRKAGDGPRLAHPPYSRAEVERLTDTVSTPARSSKKLGIAWDRSGEGASQASPMMREIGLRRWTKYRNQDSSEVLEGRCRRGSLSTRRFVVIARSREVLSVHDGVQAQEKSGRSAAAAGCRRPSSISMSGLAHLRAPPPLVSDVPDPCPVAVLNRVGVAVSFNRASVVNGVHCASCRPRPLPRCSQRF